MKKSALIFFSFLLLCKFSFAQKINLPDSSNIDEREDSIIVKPFPVSIDSSKSTHKIFFTLLSKNIQPYVQINPFQFLVHQYNIALGIKSGQLAIDFLYSNILPLKDSGPWGNRDACVAQLLSGKRFSFSIKKYTSEKQYQKITFDLSIKKTDSSSLFFSGPDDSYRNTLLFAQKRVNFGINFCNGWEQNFGPFTIGIYAGIGFKYMKLQTKRLGYITYHNNYIKGENNNLDNQTILLFNKSNYILPTLILGVYVNLHS